MAIDYGRDLTCTYDLDPMMLEIDTQRLISERVLRRLTTARGGCIDAPNDGYDLRGELSREVTQSTLVQIKAKIRSEVLKEEEVTDCKVTAISYNNGTRTLSASLLITSGDGPFPLVLSVSDVTVSLLEG